ncbi:hypothetical protein GCM10027345_35080 [Hymenobacter daeguensis]
MLCLLAGPGRAQRVRITGTARVPNKPYNTVFVTVNDSIRKITRAPGFDLATEVRLSTDSTVRARAKDGGRFVIWARPTDSLFFEAYHAIRQVHRVADLLQRPAILIELQPEPCVPYVPCRDTLPRHYAFIGQKIGVEYAKHVYYCDRFSMDSKFQARYQVLGNVYGRLPGDTVQFTAYDHYGMPQFSKHQTVLLFVSEYCQELIHQKYQYFPLYKTTDNRWAAPFPAEAYATRPGASILKPHRLRFREPVVTDLTDYDPALVAKRFPPPYYRIENHQAIAEYGSYVDELLELEKQTVLKARGVVLK